MGDDFPFHKMHDSVLVLVSIYILFRFIIIHT